MAFGPVPDGVSRWGYARVSTVAQTVRGFADGRGDRPRNSCAAVLTAYRVCSTAMTALLTDRIGGATFAPSGQCRVRTLSQARGHVINNPDVSEGKRYVPCGGTIGFPGIYDSYAASGRGHFMQNLVYSWTGIWRDTHSG